MVGAYLCKKRNLNSLVFIGYTTGSKTHVKNIMIEGLYLKCGWRPLTHWITGVFVAWVMAEPRILESVRLFLPWEKKKKMEGSSKFYPTLSRIFCSTMILTNLKFLKWGRNVQCFCNLDSLWYYSKPEGIWGQEVEKKELNQETVFVSRWWMPCEWGSLPLLISSLEKTLFNQLGKCPDSGVKQLDWLN